MYYQPWLDVLVVCVLLDMFNQLRQVTLNKNVKYMFSHEYYDAGDYAGDYTGTSLVY